MGDRGPAPKPQVMRELEGSQKQNKSEPKFKKRLPLPPEWLGTYAKEEWNRVVPEAFRVGLLTIVDETALVAYVCAYQNFRDAQDVIQRLGQTYESTQGLIKKRPECNMLNESPGIMKRYMDAFGFTPSARAKLHTPPTEGDEESKDFLFGEASRVPPNTLPN